MLTNILAAVTITLITNVVTTDNSKWERSRTIFWPEGGGPQVKVADATEKYFTTNVTEFTKVSLTINGEPKTLESSRLISSVTAIMKRVDKWEASGVKTNEPSLAAIPLWDNSFTIP